jgi:formylglycine-generating enzyme required for sulfatase activity
MVGNVWEWTRSSKEKYPYNASDGRENEIAYGYRVLRGGSFSRYEDEGVHRCANRGSQNIDVFVNFVGFRVVASPA